MRKYRNNGPTFSDASPKVFAALLGRWGERNHCRADAGSMLVKRKRDFPLYLYDGPVAYVLVTDAADRIHQAFEAGRRAAMAEVGIPTRQPILEAADEDSPEHRAYRACLAVSAH